jgi:hypothetical protein
MAGKVGRPAKVTFDDKLLACIEALIKAGKTHDEIADILGIHRATLYRYQTAHKKFRDALKSGKDVATDVVEQSLFSRATGYTAEETKVFMTKSGQIKEHTIKKHYPPDPTSLIFWLKNCAPHKWRDKIEHEHGGGDNPITLAYNTTQRLKPAKKVEDDE